MKTALINASPRGKISTSFKFLNEVKAMLPKDFETSDIQANKAALTEDQLLELKNSDIWIFANPLYIDSLPGHLLEVLEQIDASGIAQEAAHKHKVYAIINCGFYEAVQNKLAVRVYENWCKRAGLEWCGAVGIGGGGAIGFMPAEMPMSVGPLKPIYKVLLKISDSIKNGSAFDTTYVSFGFPRFLYIKCAHYGWYKAIKQNGKKIKDLYRRPATH